MKQERKKIFSRRFEKPWKETEKHVDSDTKERQKQPTLEDLYRRIEKETEYVAVPERQKTADEIIKIARLFSGLMEIDTDLVQGQDHLEIILYMTTQSLFQVETHLIGRLMIMCDKVDFVSMKDALEEYYMKLILTYYKHRQIVNGRDCSTFD